MENLEEIEIGTSVVSFQKILDSQKELFHCQIDQLQRIVVTQCKLTGVNPLSQEMAAGAMSIKIGKRPRDLLNPKAIKYMQAVFSMKDAISKKECREISAQFGVTVTQVRDFFNSQRSRVRKLVRLSREKVARANSYDERQDGVPTSSDPMVPIDMAPLNSVYPDLVNFVGSNPAPLSSVGSDPAPLSSIASNAAPLISVGPNPAPLSSIGSSPAPLNSVGSHPAPLNSFYSSPVLLNTTGTDPSPLLSVGPSNLEEAPSCSMQDDILPGLHDQDRHFVENIFNLLRKEETFSGQVKLMEWILQIQNPSVLNWFLTKGGVMILATWLSQAAAEEQTSMLLVTLKVLCHLPLHKAVPEHMSAILHSVNRLRFYRTSDISNRARVLLSRWSKMFARAQAMKKPNGMKSSMDPQEMILKQSIDEIMGNELWHPNGNNLEDVLALSESSENMRKMEPSQTLKLLPAPTDDSSRKHILGVLSSHTRERRKVQLVEQPGQKTGGRGPQATKAAPASQGRPMSTDDIQKAKMRALFMQSKQGKTVSSSNGINGMKKGGLSKLSSALSGNLSSSSEVPLLPKVEETKKSVVAPQKNFKQEGPLDPIRKMDLKEPLEDLCKRVRIPWQTPPEIKLNDLWRVGNGENSKEVDVQKNRNRREIEIIYRTVQDIPANPKAPWDVEMDYDDTLTPEIPIEQPPDADVAETQVIPNEKIVNTVVTPAPTLPQINGGSAAEPDLELLAVLLKNPELVFALTSGHAGNISPQDTVKLLDMIKRSGTGLADSVNVFGGKVEEKVEVSLPSPTPSSNPGTAGWRPQVVKNPFSQQNSRGKRVAYSDRPVPTTIPSMQPQNLDSNIKIPQQQATASPQSLSQQVQSAIPRFSLPQTTSSSYIHENQQLSMIFPSHQSLPTNSSMLHTKASEMGLPMNTPHARNFLAGSSVRVETVNHVQPAQSVSYAMNTPERQPVSSPLPPSLPITTRAHPQTHLVSDPVHVHQSTGNMGSMPESWRSRQLVASNSVSQVNQTNYDASSFRGPAQPQVRPGPPWERNEYMGNDGFESWSPENSPSRSPEYMPGRNYPGPGTNPGWNYNPDNRARQRDYNSGHRDQTRNGNRRWR
ncbi:homeobox protein LUMINIDEPENDENS isoform X2 [Ricinus communis]|uniref:homeobox protein LUMINIDEPENDENS isoform X2 n=1 Tax=Ricinus communis TaxID=3988 RepID=UPI000772CC84|nr:homeobox protein LUMINIDEPENDENS isoform X2 [Ricinus communis]|eukprot:XP_015575659.1 homeobox protein LUMINIDEPENDENS [Ricinus communis]